MIKQIFDVGLGWYIFYNVQIIIHDHEDGLMKTITLLTGSLKKVKKNVVIKKMFYSLVDML